MTLGDLEEAWARIDALLNNDGKFVSGELPHIRECARVIGEFCTGLYNCMSDEAVAAATERYLKETANGQ